MSSAVEDEGWSYCEPSPTLINMLCIRPLTEMGRRLTGGVDTPSLCGRVDPQGFGGWDVERPFSWDEAARDSRERFHGHGEPLVCPRCVEARPS